ncbi:DUF1311 domain-containing protein [Paraburkholderia acidicola]|uniref:DUF1311 domain-containing protein n=1 Tax=Paraburkholderia acidicola TaxID=1912599 RepID=A0ABV1LF53_9BURK
MKISPVVLLFSTSVFSLSAHAATLAKVDPVHQCFERAQSQEQQASCYDQAITTQKKRLNAAYNRLLARRKNTNDQEGIAALNQMQRDWIKWRDETTSYLNEHVAGSGSAVFEVTENFLLDAATKQAELLETMGAMEGGE